MKRQLAVACLLILASAPPPAAGRSNDGSKSGPPAPKQKAAPGSESLPPELKDAFQPVQLPEGKDAWALQIVTRGGLTGKGRGDVTVTSDGRVTCSPQNTPCALKQPDATLSQRVAAARPSKWRSAAGGSCRDCYLTLFVLQRRKGNGAEKTYTLYWDDTTAASVPADVKAILRAVAAVTFVPARVL